MRRFLILVWIRDCLNHGFSGLKDKQDKEGLRPKILRVLKFGGYRCRLRKENEPVTKRIHYLRT